MVQCLWRLKVQLLSVLYSIVITSRAIFKSSSIQQTKWHLDFFLSVSLQLPYALFKRGIFSAYPTQVNSIFSLTLKLLAPIAALDYFIQAWFYSWPGAFCRFKQSLLFFEGSSVIQPVWKHPCIEPSLSPSLFINSFFKGISPSSHFLLLVFTTDGNNCSCLHWVDVLINSSTKHRKGKFFRKWRQIAITHLSFTSIPEWHAEFWMGSVSIYTGTCPSILQSLGPWYGIKHHTGLVGMSREDAIGMEDRRYMAYAIMLAIVTVWVGRLGSQTPWPWRQTKAVIWVITYGGLSSSVTEKCGSERFIQTSEIQLTLDLFVSMRRTSARLFANFPATMI